MNKKMLLSAVLLMIVLVVIGVWTMPSAAPNLPDASWGAKDNGAGGSEEAEDAAATAECNWGLSFREKGKAPVGNATSEYLKQYHGYYIDSSSIKEKRVYLTFDAGYENGYTAKILDVLKAENVPAAFFLVGSYIEENPELVRRMEAEGHIVGNHTMHHSDMAAISDKAAFEQELIELETAYKNATGKEMKKFYRPPQGKYSEANLKQASELGYRTVFWSLAYVDWYRDDQPTQSDAMNILNERIHPGAIVLLHSTSKTNSEILAGLIKNWKEKGYSFQSIDNILT